MWRRHSCLCCASVATSVCCTLQRLLVGLDRLPELPASCVQTVYGAAGIAKELADDEIAHVRFLRAALGDAAAPCPKMDIGAAFAAAANAAAGAALEPTFDPYANDLFFLHGAFIFEDVGVTAYNGAVPAATALLPASARLLRSDAHVSVLVVLLPCIHVAAACTLLPMRLAC